MKDFRHFDIRIRFPEEFRSSDDDIGNLQVPTSSGSKVPIKQIATISQKTGPCLIFRDDNERYSAIKFSIEGRDMGSAIKEAQEKVEEKVKLKKGYNMVWQGDFENQQRASKRLAGSRAHQSAAHFPVIIHHVWKFERCRTGIS